MLFRPYTSCFIRKSLPIVALAATTTSIFIHSSSSLPLVSISQRQHTSFRPNKFVSRNMSNTMSDDSNCWKRAKLDDKKNSDLVIGTHSGTFQADEALGVWLLRQTDMYRNSKVTRSRDIPMLEEQCDIILDVGGIYNHEALRYDHHQREYNEKFDSERITKLSASGLIYRHYGKEVISSFYPNLPSNLLDLVYVKMYDRFMEAIDAIDTGVEPSTTPLLYKDSTCLSSRVSRLNPRWNEEDKEGPDARFETASNLCGSDFVNTLIPLVESDLPARAFVQKAMEERFQTDSSGQIICLSSGGMPWKSHVYELEQELGVEKEILYVLYTDQGGMWRIQCVSVEGQAFTNRLGLPSSWRGVRDDLLSDVAGIPNCRFCHASGFIGGNDTFEGALKMAQVSLQQQNN